MARLHRTTLNIFNKLCSIIPVHEDKSLQILVTDDSMCPTLPYADVVHVDVGGFLKHGSIVALSTEKSVEFREVQFFDSEIYLIPHNKKYPNISMKDYRELNDGAYIIGVVVK